MRQRAFIHIAGPHRAGKTTLTERLLEFSPSILLVARCAARSEVDSFIEDRSKNDADLARYRKAGAYEVARYRFRPGLERTDTFWMTNLMENYSEGVIIEGDLPIEGADLTVFVTRPLPARTPLLRRVLVDRSQAHERGLKWMESLIDNPRGAEEFMTTVFGNPAIPSMLNERKMEQWRSIIKTGVEESRAQGPPPPDKKWALAEELQGIEPAGVVAINISHEKERKRAERMLDELRRLRNDEEIFKDVIRRRGTRRPITVRVVNLSDPEDKNLKFLLRRIQRTIREVARQG